MKTIQNISSKTDSLLIVSESNDEIYQQIISEQSDVYNLIITVFIGLVAIFAGATWLYNRKVAKKDIQEELESMFEKERENLLDTVRQEYKSELYLQRAENSRLFALFNFNLIQNKKDGEDVLFPHVNMVYWWSEVFLYHALSSNSAGERLAVEHLIQSLKSVKDFKIESSFKNAFNQNYNYDNLFQVVETIPEILKPERTTILSYLIEYNLYE